MGTYRYYPITAGHEHEPFLPTPVEYSFDREIYSPTPLNPSRIEKWARRDPSDFSQHKEWIRYDEDADNTIAALLLHRPDDVPDHVVAEMNRLVLLTLHHRLINNSSKNVFSQRIKTVIPNPMTSDYARSLGMDPDHIETFCQTYNSVFVDKPMKPDAVSIELFHKACMGVATPSQLLSLLGLQRHLRSIELAKQSHPYQWGVTSDMDERVVNEFEALDDAVLCSQPSTEHYVLDTVRPETLTAGIVRKAKLGYVALHGTDIKLIERDSFVLDLQSPANAAIKAELLQWFSQKGSEVSIGGNKIKLPVGLGVVGTVENALDDGTSQDHKGLHPAVRSYYACVT